MTSMEEATPRAIIRSLLTTSSIQKSAKSTRQRKTTRATNQRNLSVMTPSEKEVAFHFLTRTTRSSRKRRAASVATPSDSTTPRTLITGFLQTAAVTRSTLKGKRRKVQDAKSGSTLKEDSNIHGVEGAEDNTPRTIIQNFLREATRELPEEAVVSGSSNNNEETAIVEKDHMSVNQGQMHNSQAEMSTTEEGDTSFRSHQITLIPSEAISGRVEALNSGLVDTYENSLDFGSNEKEVVDGEPSMVSQALQTESVSRSVAQASSHWRDLITPQLPLDMLSTVGEESGAKEDLDQSSIAERTLPLKKPPTGEPRETISRNVGPRMPSALVKSIFQHFSKAKLSKEALETIQNGSDLFFKQVSSDLMAFSRHAHRSTIELADVELLMKRQSFITKNQSLYSLVENYLPLEYRQLIIPTARAGNSILPK